MTRKNGLPRRVYLHHGAFFYVDMGRKWHRLCSESDGLPAMFRAYADLTERSEQRAGMPDTVAGWLADSKGEWSASHLRNMSKAASEMARRLEAFSPADITTPVCVGFLATYRDTPRWHNIMRNALGQVLARAARLA